MKPEDPDPTEVQTVIQSQIYSQLLKSYDKAPAKRRWQKTPDLFSLGHIDGANPQHETFEDLFGHLEQNSQFDGLPIQPPKEVCLQSCGNEADSEFDEMLSQNDEIYSEFEALFEEGESHGYHFHEDHDMVPDSQEYIASCQDDKTEDMLNG